MFSQPKPGDGESARRFAAILRVALVAVGAAGIAVWLLLALSHLDDRYLTGHVQGAWMAQARYVNEGMLYPPLSDGVRFAGTRWMPLPIIVNAAAGRLTGEYLVSGKGIATVLFAVLLVLVLVILRQSRCPHPLAVALVGLLPATNIGVLVGSTVGGDVLPVALQIGALAAVTANLRREQRASIVAAGILAGLAACSKLTGVWATLAALGFLSIRRDWRRLGWFAVAAVSTTVLTLAFVQWRSQGRFLTTFLTLTFAGMGGPGNWIRSPNQLIFFGIEDAAAIWIIAPFALLAVLAAGHASAFTVYHHALGWSLVLTLLAFTDVGAGLNQLLDPAVLTVITVGYLGSSVARDRLGTLTLHTALAVSIVWAGITGIRGFVPDLRRVAASLRTGTTPERYNARPLADAVAPGDTLLSEDPSIPILLGQLPIVADPFMLRRLDEVQSETVDVLVERIERGTFDHVALINPLDADDAWWRDYHFGLRIVRALRKSYVLIGQVDGYYLYQPNGS